MNRPAEPTKADRQLGKASEAFLKASQAYFDDLTDDVGPDLNTTDSPIEFYLLLKAQLGLWEWCLYRHDRSPSLWKLPEDEEV